MKINAFRAFRSRNFSLYFFGQSVSMIGTWMQRTAIYWLVFVQTHSTFMLGMAVFATQFPSFLFSPLGGIISDRYNRYRITLISQIASMAQAIALAVLVIATKYTVWEIFALSILLGIINAFDLPARQSMINDLFENKDDLPNGIALYSAMAKLAWLIGPAASGVILEKMGAGICFSLNALSFVAVIVSLLLMKFPAFIPPTQKKKIIKEFSDGFVYIKNTPKIGLLILLLAFVSLLILPYNTLMPVYAKDIFKGGASIFGYLNSFVGLGALCGALFLTTLKPNANFQMVLVINLLIFGIALILFSHITTFSIALIFALMMGFAQMSQTTLGNTIIQVNATAEMRGRVISFFAMAFYGMLPIGGLLIGTLSQYIGAQNTILFEGFAAVVLAAIFYPSLKRNGM